MKYLLLLFLTVSISSKELINTSETEARIYYSVDNQWTILTENFDETKQVSIMTYLTQMVGIN